MRILKTGDLCPICGQPILTEDSRTLRLLAAIADIAGLPDREDEAKGLHEGAAARSGTAFEEETLWERSISTTGVGSTR